MTWNFPLNVIFVKIDINLWHIHVWVKIKKRGFNKQTIWYKDKEPSLKYDHLTRVSMHLIDPLEHLTDAMMGDV